MTIKTNARIAGATFILYIVTGISSMLLLQNASFGENGFYPLSIKIDILLSLLMAAYALLLGVTIYALTRKIDRDLAIMALFCRAGEGVIAILSILKTTALSTLLTHSKDVKTQNLLEIGIQRIDGGIFLIAGICFSLGSTIYCFLFLKGNSIPSTLGWLGLLSSLILLIILPLKLAGFIKGAFHIAWLPMLIFELVLAFWLWKKGISVPEISAFKEVPNAVNKNLSTNCRIQ